MGPRVEYASFPDQVGWRQRAHYAKEEWTDTDSAHFLLHPLCQAPVTAPSGTGIPSLSVGLGLRSITKTHVAPMGVCVGGGVQGSRNMKSGRSGTPGLQGACSVLARFEKWLGVKYRFPFPQAEPGEGWEGPGIWTLGPEKPAFGPEMKHRVKATGPVACLC